MQTKGLRTQIARGALHGTGFQWHIGSMLVKNHVTVSMSARPVVFRLGVVLTQPPMTSGDFSWLTNCPYQKTLSRGQNLRADFSSRFTAEASYRGCRGVDAIACSAEGESAIIGSPPATGKSIERPRVVRHVNSRIVRPCLPTLKSPVPAVQPGKIP